MSEAYPNFEPPLTADQAFEFDAAVIDAKLGVVEQIGWALGAATGAAAALALHSGWWFVPVMLGVYFAVRHPYAKKSNHMDRLRAERFAQR